MKNLTMTLLSIVLSTMVTFASEGTTAHKKDSQTTVKAATPSENTSLQQQNKMLLRKIELLADAQEDLQASMAFQQVMNQTLTVVAAEKHQALVEDMQCEIAYQQLMATTLRSIQDRKYADHAKDIESSLAFNTLMQKMLQLITQ